MKNKILSVLQSETNLTYNVKKGVLYGTYKEYYTSVQAFQSIIILCLPLKLTETYTINEMNSLLFSITEGYKNIKSAAYNNNEVHIRYEYKTVSKSNADNILKIINTLIQVANSNYLTTCCPMCGENTPISPFFINKMFVPCCDHCKLGTKNSIANQQDAVKQQHSNIIGGTVGAFLGSLIGVALWVVVGLARYIAAISGFVLAICTIKGYQLFGGKLDKKGIFITIIITLLMVFVSEYISFSLDIFNEFKIDYGITFFDAIKSVPEFLKDSDVSFDFYKNLGLGYFFTIICAYSQFKHSYKESNFNYTTEEI